MRNHCSLALGASCLGALHLTTILADFSGLLIRLGDVTLELSFEVSSVLGVVEHWGLRMAFLSNNMGSRNFLFLRS